MGYFAFRLDELNVRYQRGKVMDVDIVALTVAVNGQPHGKIAGRFNASSGARIPAKLVEPDVRGRFGLALGGWIVGPIYIEPEDLVEVIYSGFNISDTPQGSDEKIAALELKMLDAYYGALTGVAAGEALASVIASVVGGFSGLTETVLGYKPRATCNGLVFSDTRSFTGSGLSKLPFVQRSAYVESDEVSFTYPYDDAATHDAACGHIAETDVTFSVLRFPYLSLWYFKSFFWPYKDFRKGLRQLEPPGQPTSIREMICS